MGSMNMKEYSTLVVIREMPINILLKRALEKLNYSYIFGGNVKWYSQSGKQLGSFLAQPYVKLSATQ